MLTRRWVFGDFCDWRFRRRIVECSIQEGLRFAPVARHNNIGVAMFRVVYLQMLVSVVVAALAGVVVGMRGGVSAALGGLICALPNLLFAAHLRFLGIRPRASFATHFLLGELVKLLMTFSLLLVVVRIYPDLHWPSMLIGLVLALQAVFLALWKRTDHVDES